MAKLIRTLVPENNMNFADVVAFKTEQSFVGVWNDSTDCFILMAEEGRYFDFTSLPDCKTLEQLNDMVYKACDEHITDVFDKSDYKITLGCDKVH